MKNKSVMQHRFDTTPKAEIQRSSFDRSHGYKTTFDSGYLVPFYCDEALPGDTFNLKVTAFARLATPIKPVMDNMYMETFFFSVPVRQVWENWEKFNGEQRDPGDSTDFTVPTIDMGVGGASVHTIYDYMGIPTDFDLTVNALHLRAYNHIYNIWFRDQNLQTARTLAKNDGPDLLSYYDLMRRRKRPDYFTSALPWPQKDNGNPVTVPISGTAPVTGIGLTGTGVFSETSTPVRESDQTTPTYAISRDLTGVGTWHIEGTAASAGYPAVFADLSQASGITINELRQSFQIQRLLERDARGGTRYPEILKAHFGVTDPSMLVLQRPEFLGGGSSRINIAPVEQTAQTVTGTDASPQGNLAGFGTVTLQGHGFTKSFTEHCLIIGIVNVRADLTYQQGLNRMWSRQTRYDYFWPALAHLGEQEILNKEIFADASANDELVFGYQERYAEYRYKPSLITGQFRSSYVTTLDIWHLSQEFLTLPALSANFIEDVPPVKRVIAVQTEPEFLFDAYIDLRCARPMPLYGVPGMIDHF